MNKGLNGFNLSGHCYRGLGYLLITISVLPYRHATSSRQVIFGEYDPFIGNRSLALACCLLQVPPGQGTRLRPMHIASCWFYIYIFITFWRSNLASLSLVEKCRVWITGIGPTLIHFICSSTCFTKCGDWLNSTVRWLLSLLLFLQYKPTCNLKLITQELELPISLQAGMQYLSEGVPKVLMTGRVRGFYPRWIFLSGVMV